MCIWRTGESGLQNVHLKGCRPRTGPLCGLFSLPPPPNWFYATLFSLAPLAPEPGGDSVCWVSYFLRSSGACESPQAKGTDGPSMFRSSHSQAGSNSQHFSLLTDCRTKSSSFSSDWRLSIRTKEHKENYWLLKPLEWRHPPPHPHPLLPGGFSRTTTTHLRRVVVEFLQRLLAVAESVSSAPAQLHQETFLHREQLEARVQPMDMLAEDHLRRPRTWSLTHPGWAEVRLCHVTTSRWKQSVSKCSCSPWWRHWLLISVKSQTTSCRGGKCRFTKPEPELEPFTESN